MQCPLFVLPLHKSLTGYITLVVQTKMPYATFTAIDDFRKVRTVRWGATS